MKKLMGVALACGILCCSCAKKYDSATASYPQATQNAKGGAAAKSMSSAAYEMASESADMDVMDESTMDAEAASGSSRSTSTTSTIERKLIRTGNIDTEVESLSDTRTMLNEWVKKYDGYISDSNESSRNLRATVRVPSRYFEQAMNDATGFGKLRTKNVSSEDVTDQYYDLSTRLTTKRLMLERLENYLKEAKDVKDMIEIEGRINDVTTDIESMQGRLNRLAALVDYSTIHINATLPAMQTEKGFELPDAKNSFREFAGNVIHFLVGLFFIVLYVIFFGIPLVLLLSLFYWICFGKIGILRKLFQKISVKKEKK